MFHQCQSLEEAKILFRKLAFYLHPDHGGDSQLMILLQESFENFKDYIEYLEFEKQKKEQTEKNQKYETQIDDVYELDIEKLKIIDEILKYSENHPRFKADYTESVKEYLEEHGFITSQQYNSLVKVYYAFRMDKEQK